MFSMISRLFLFLLTLLISLRGFAAQEEFSDYSESLNVGDEVQVYDDKYTVMQVGSGWTNLFTNYKVSNRVTIGFVPDATMTTSSSVSVTLKVTMWKYIGGTFVSNVENRVLTLSYDANIYNTVTDQNSFLFENAHGVKVEVTATSGNVSQVFLENVINVERYYKMSDYLIDDYQVAFSGVNNQTVVMSWDYHTGAEEYELEWTFISDYDYSIENAQTTAVPATSIPFNFYKNSTRVKTTTNFYEIPAVFNRGYLLFRVRPIGRQGALFNYPLVGDWTQPESGNVGGFPAAAKLYISNDFDPGKNWMQNVAYSEDGKRLSSLSFADGLGRVRQTSFHNTATDQLVIRNLYFDFSGRPVVTDLPTPVEATSFAFRQHFNMLDNNGVETTIDAGTIEALLATQSTCGAIARRFSKNYGTGRYYSTNHINPEGTNNYIPDADGFVYTMVKYMNDPTGRISEVGKYGFEHQQGKHTDKFYYSTVEQIELSSLFGSEVGYSQHYQKNYGIDPNGQAVTQYYDMSGRLIASALSSGAPANLMPLDDNVAVTATNQVIFNGALPINGDSDPAPEISTYTHYKVILEEQEYGLSHSFDPSVFTDECLPAGFCFDCMYEFEITINSVDCPSENPIYHHQEFINGVTINTICDGAGYDGHDVSIPLGVGQYAISKTLRVKETAAADYWCTYIDNTTCIDDYSTYYDALYNTVNFGCSTVTVEPAEYNYCDYKRSIMATHMSVGGQYGTLDAVNQPNAYALSVYNESNQLTSGGTWRNPPIPYTNEDGSPAIIYLNVIGGGYAPEIAAGATILYDTEGAPYILPEDLAHLSDFVNYAQPAWGDALVEYHPEYCYLVFCEQSSDYHDYTQLIEETTSYDVACSLGLFNPLGATGGPSSIPTVGPLDAFSSCNFSNSNGIRDDYFVSGYYSTIQPWIIANYSCLLPITNNVGGALLNYYPLPDASGTLSIWQYAAWKATCSGLTNYTAIVNCINNAQMQECDKAAIWNHFKGAYTSLRKKYFQMAQGAYVSFPENLPGGGCGPTNNECIGNPFFNRFSMIQCMDVYKHSDLTDLNNDSQTTVGIPADDVGPCAKYTEFLYETMVPVFFNGLPPVDAPDDMNAYLDAQVLSSCQSICEAQADDWMSVLAGCGITPGTQQYNDIRAGLIEVCVGGCDLQNMGGASTVATPGVGNYDSFEEVLQSVLGSNYQNYNCSQYLIGDIRPYGQGVQHQLTNSLDECGCDLILQAEYDLINNPVAGITTVEQMLAHTTGIQYTVNDLACLCNAAYALTGTWSPAAVWSSASANYLADGALPVPNSLTCNGTHCTDCVDMNATYADFIAEFGVGVEVHANYELLLANYVNIHGGTYYSADQIIGFMTACNSTSGEPNCALTNVAPVFQDLIDVIARRGQLMRESANAVDLSTENIVYEYSNINQLLDGRYYWSCGANCNPSDELTLYFGATPGTATATTFTMILPDAADFGFGDIIGIPELLPETNCTGPNLLLTVHILKCGKVEERELLAQTSDIELIDCYCGNNTTLTLCSEGTGFNPGNLCYQDILYQIGVEAEEGLEGVIADERVEFINNYNLKCAAGFSTELLEESSMENAYHKTLFYYDQAGNLVKTIAPKGVDNSFDGALGYGGMSNSQSQVPAHKYETKYQYNSYNQLVSTTNPDQQGPTRFWYDKLGRIAASQNPQQALENKYSYTLYDQLGRISSTGQTVTTVPLTTTILRSVLWESLFGQWVGNGTQTEITIIRYDEDSPPVAALFYNGKQENTRLRIASLYYYDVEGPVGDYASAIYYSYDEHGNVKEQIQDVPALTPVQQDKKSTQYAYELISGNMKEVAYQKGKRDALTHRYHYDELNRLTEVEASISNKGIYFDRQARYHYYDYGPLARIEYGQKQVQGQDFAYTINGWLKGMNASVLQRDRDMGKDGTTGYLTSNPSAHTLFARDVTAYTLGYFDGDYASVSGNRFELNGTGSTLNTQARNLYNGNIRSLVTSITGMTTETMGKVFRYDQLNRLKEMTAYYYDGNTNYSWNGINSTLEYYNSYSYDKNGNITKLQRNGINVLGLTMDNLDYKYIETTVNGGFNNRLSWVDDLEGASTHGNLDIDHTMNAGNYGYNRLGQLTKDVDEGIATIEWFSGNKKVKKITRNDANSSQVEFMYNPMGERIVKLEKPRSGGSLRPKEEWKYTYYSYDANGQVMAVYDIQLGSANNRAYLAEQHVYGSTRLGMIRQSKALYVNGAILDPATDVFPHTEGQTYYELSNYLGNVEAVITDRKIPEMEQQYFGRFDGVNDIARTSSFSADLGTTVSMEAWVRCGTIVSNSVVAAQYLAGSTNKGTHIVVFPNGRVAFEGRTGTTTYHSSGPSTTLVNDGEWHHVAGTCDGTVWKVYVDGVLESTYTASTAGSFSGLTYVFSVGGNAYGTYFKGDVKEVSYWNTLRTATEIAADMYTTFSGAETGLKGYWRFADNTNPSDDASTGNHTINLQNGAVFGSESVLSFYQAVVIRTADYYPYGMLMPGRHKDHAPNNYRFGYNGMELDNAIKNNGNSYTTEFRLYDPRLGRWLSLDPLMAKYPWMSPYTAFNNNPIFFIDPLGLEGVEPGEADKQKGSWVGPSGVTYKYDKEADSWSSVEFTVTASKMSSVSQALWSIGKFIGIGYTTAGQYRPKGPSWLSNMTLANHFGDGTGWQGAIPEGHSIYYDPLIDNPDHPMAASWGKTRAQADAVRNVVVGTLVVGAAAPLVAGVAINTAPVWMPYMISGANYAWQGARLAGQYSWQGAKIYHNTFGKTGGYVNMFLDAGLQNVAAPNEDFNYYSFIGSGFLPGNSFKTITAFEVSTVLISVNNKGVNMSLPNSQTSFDKSTSIMWNYYGTSKWGTPMLGLYWDATFKGAANNNDNNNK